MTFKSTSTPSPVPPPLSASPFIGVRCQNWPAKPSKGFSFVLGLAMICLSLFAFSSLRAQPGHLSSSAQSLHHLFQKVDPVSNPSADLHYGRSGHLVDERYFDYVYQDLDTNYHSQWFRMYDEVRYMHWHYDTASIDIADDVYRAVVNKYGGDTIPIGIMDYKFYRLKEDALTTSKYFIFHTSAGYLEDDPNRTDHGFQSDLSQLFAASPLKAEAQFSNVTYAIDPDFIFKDGSAGSYPNKGIRIDYGDGSGWHTYNGNLSSTIYETITYDASGTKYLQIEILPSPSTPDPVRACRAKVEILADNPRPVPSQLLEFPGMTVGKFGSCNAEAPDRSIIYVEGIDLVDQYSLLNRDVSQIYQEMIQDERLANLRNFGYNYYVVDWNDSKLNLNTNSAALVNFIDWLKCEVDNDHQFVVIGESMGGLIARNALTYMETGNYANDPEVCRAEQMHQTRLFMSLDAPHQGANVPISIQAAYLNYFNGQMGGVLGVAERLTSILFEDWLDSDASRQMLLHHIYNGNGNNEFGPDPLYNDFQSNLGMPQFCKTMAIANGNLAGEPQHNFYQDIDRTPGDRLIDFEMDIENRILGVTVPKKHFELELRTNPAGSGMVYDYERQKFTLDIDVSLFNVNVSWDPDPINTSNLSVNNAVPYGVNAAGIYGNDDDQPIFENSLTDIWVLRVDAFNNGNGCSGINAHAGLNGFFSKNMSLNVCTDGMHFGFIPTASALDIGTIGNQPPDFNYEANWTVNQLLSSSPFDVIQASPTLWDPFDDPIADGLLNRHHLNLRNEEVESDLNGSVELFTCREEEDIFNQFHNYHLNKEIGDQVLYLNNMDLNREAVFQAEFALLVNVDNPFYDHGSGQGLNSIYSEDDPFLINSGHATFIYDPNSPVSTYTYAPPVTNPFTVVREPLPICCNIYNSKRRQYSNTTVDSTGIETLELYPNPVSDKLLLKVKLSKEQRFNAQIIDGSGRVITGKQLYYRQGHLHDAINLTDLAPGFYYLRASSIDSQFQVSFIKK